MRELLHRKSPYQARRVVFDPLPFDGRNAMTKRDVPECPDCDSMERANGAAVSRRSFLRNVSAASLAAIAAPSLPAAVAQAPAVAASAAAAFANPPSPAED